MKIENIKSILFILVLLSALVFFSTCDKIGKDVKEEEEVSTPVSKAPKNDSGVWVAKIDLEGLKFDITEGELNDEFDIVLDSQNIPEGQREIAKNNMTYKQQLLDQLIGEYLIVNKAEDEGFFEEPQARQFLSSQIRKLKMQYYLKTKYLDKMPEPSEQEIQALYKQAKPRLKQAGYTTLNAEVREYLVQQIKIQKLQRKTLMIIQDLKDAARISKNEEIIGTPSMDYQPGQMGGGSGLMNNQPMQDVPFGQ